MITFTDILSKKPFQAKTFEAHWDDKIYGLNGDYYIDLDAMATNFIREINQDIKEGIRRGAIMTSPQEFMIRGFGPNGEESAWVNVTGTP